MFKEGLWQRIRKTLYEVILIQTWLLKFSGYEVLLDIKWKSKSGAKRKKESEVAQLCSTLCDPVDCSLPGSSIHGILQARILEWVAISFSRGSSRPRDQIQVSCIAGRRFML